MGWGELSEPGFFIGLPGRHYWRSYIAIGDEGVIASATMMQHFQATQLGFAGTEEAARGRGAHMALLRRRIVDALATWLVPVFDQSRYGRSGNRPRSCSRTRTRTRTSWKTTGSTMATSTTTTTSSSAK